MTGKRAWKETHDGGRRQESNTLYRGHRLSEIRNEANFIMEATNQQSADTRNSHLKELCHHMLTRLIYFSGGGSTGLDEGKKEKVGVKETTKQLISSAGASFGLMRAYAIGSSDKKAYSQSPAAIPSNKLRKNLITFADLKEKPVLAGDGFLDCSVVFSGATARKDRPLDIELGSGFGDWIVTQARKKEDRNFIAVELRSDRVAQAFSRIMIGSTNRVKNLCCVGAEASSFLRDRIRNGTVSTIFVNHPEPPTQAFGSDEKVLSSISDGGDEPGHMLTSKALIHAAECLKRGEGRVVIVTDNQLYGRLICATISKVQKTHPKLIKPLFLQQDEFRIEETFRGKVNLYEGQPNELIGHSRESGGGSGQSYFDRLWNTGAGSYSDKTSRYITGFTR